MTTTCQFITARGPRCDLDAVIRLSSTDPGSRDWELCSPHAEALVCATNHAVRTRLGLLSARTVYAEDFQQALDDAWRSG